MQALGGNILGRYVVPWPQKLILHRKRYAFSDRLSMAGKYYVAIFNLEEEQVEVSVPLVDERENARQAERHGASRAAGECRGKEAWSNQNVGTVKGKLHAGLAPHGCALFSLSCSLS